MREEEGVEKSMFQYEPTEKEKTSRTRRVTTVIEVSFEMGTVDDYREIAKWLPEHPTWDDAVGHELAELHIEGLGDDLTFKVVEPGDPRFRFEGGELDDPLFGGEEEEGE